MQRNSHQLPCPAELYSHRHQGLLPEPPLVAHALNQAPSQEDLGSSQTVHLWPPPRPHSSKDGRCRGRRLPGQRTQGPYRVVDRTAKSQLSHLPGIDWMVTPQDVQSSVTSHHVKQHKASTMVLTVAYGCSYGMAVGVSLTH